MQTFLPYADFEASLACLDYKRLGKQRVEVLQILKGQWIHHPATKMWRGYENSLCIYGVLACEEYIRRGYKDTVKESILAIYDKTKNNLHPMPPWFGHSEFHVSHQSNLKRKYPDYYPFDVSDNIPYCWPTLINGKWILRFKHAGAPQYIKSMEIEL